MDSQLKSLVFRDLEGVKTRSRAQWLEEGEKPECERIEHNSLTSILNSDGNEVFSRDEIEHAHVLFYTKLFSSEPIDESCKQQLLQGFSCSLSEADRVFCDGDISLAELAESLGGLSLYKSPGRDGFTVEFFGKFWHLLGPFLLQVACECFRDGMLPQSMKGSAMRLIYKKRGDKKDLKIGGPLVCSMSIIKLFLKFLLLVCLVFSVLLFILIKLVRSLAVQFLLTWFYCVIFSITFSELMRRQSFSALVKKRLLIALIVHFSLISFVTSASALFFGSRFPSCTRALLCRLL